MNSFMPSDRTTSSTSSSLSPVPTGVTRTNSSRLAGRLLPVALLGLLFGQLLTSCNTVEGLGEDVESVGESTSEASRDVRK